MVNKSETKAQVEQKDIYSITSARMSLQNIYFHLTATAKTAFCFQQTLDNSAVLAFFDVQKISIIPKVFENGIFDPPS